jgi:hypothetical protein
MTMERPLSGPIGEHKYTVMCGWAEVPHLDAAMQKSLLDTCEPHLRAARTQGIPSMGAGAVYPVTTDEISVEPFAIPSHWPRMYAMDVGWRRTAALWLAQDPDTGLMYAYAEHYRGRAIPMVHAQAIKGRGDWIPGTIDPASRTSSQKDGEQLLYLYQNQGLKLTPAINAVEAGIHSVWTMLQTGQLKLFSTLVNTFAEMRMYRRELDDKGKGKIVKKNDHLMDCLRYGVVMFHALAITKPVFKGSFGSSEPADSTAGY